MRTLFPRAPSLRDRVRAEAENRPGVYWMLDRAGTVIYVGRSIRIRTRLLSYFRGPPDSKPRRIVRDAAGIRWRYTPGDLGARLEELRAIRRFRPRHNRQLTGTAGFFFLRLGPAAVPRLHVVRRLRPDASRYYGPFRGRSWLEETARILSDWAGLRTCADATPMRLDDQGLLFGERPSPLCPRYELGRCAGPCAERCDEAEYRRRVSCVNAFLTGEDARPIDDLGTLMDEAAGAMNFEFAARIRDRIDRLLDYRALVEAETRRMAGLTGAYAVVAEGGARWWYFLANGRVLAEEPSGHSKPPPSFHDVARRIEARGSPVPGAGCPFAAQEAGLIAAWFDRRPEERARIVPPASILRRALPETGQGIGPGA